jgi:hypothetical protein
MTPPLLPGTTELLVLPDGQVLAHNLTPQIAALLAALDPNDPGMAARAKASRPHATQSPFAKSGGQGDE